MLIIKSLTFPLYKLNFILLNYNCERPFVTEHLVRFLSQLSETFSVEKLSKIDLILAECFCQIILTVKSCTFFLALIGALYTIHFALYTFTL